MTTAIIERAITAARARLDLARIDLVGAAIAWSRSGGSSDWTTHAAYVLALRRAVRVYERAIHRLVHFDGALARRQRVAAEARQ